MKTMYVVTSGCYSDYRVDGVFDTKEAAEDFVLIVAADSYGGDDVRIEEYELNPTRQIEEEAIEVHMLRDGTARLSRPFLDELPNGEVEIDGDEITTIVKTKDPKTAIKVANERRVAFIAAGHWPEGE